MTDTFPCNKSIVSATLIVFDLADNIKQSLAEISSSRNDLSLFDVRMFVRPFNVPLYHFLIFKFPYNQLNMVMESSEACFAI